MNDFNPGDRVRLKPFGVEVIVVDHYDGPHYQVRTDDGSEFTIDKRVFELTDDPSKAPVGTMRPGKGAFRHTSFVKVRRDYWVTVRDEHPGDHPHRFTDAAVSKSSTPAAEEQKPPRVVPLSEIFPPWTGDGSEEPPAHVRKVRDSLNQLVDRAGNGWWYADGSDPNGRGWAWNSGMKIAGPYREVRD
jgi:hypothetical protein